jgi:hypothetical protein
MFIFPYWFAHILDWSCRELKLEIGKERRIGAG